MFIFHVFLLSLSIANSMLGFVSWVVKYAYYTHLGMFLLCIDRLSCIYGTQTNPKVGFLCPECNYFNGLNNAIKYQRPGTVS